MLNQSRPACCRNAWYYGTYLSCSYMLEMTLQLSMAFNHQQSPAKGNSFELEYRHLLEASNNYATIYIMYVNYIYLYVHKDHVTPTVQCALLIEITITITITIPRGRCHHKYFTM